MNRLATVLACALLSACGGSQRPASDSAPAAPAAPADPRSPIERRRDDACTALGPRITACAVEDARADLAAGKVSQTQFERDTAPEIQRKNTAKFVEACQDGRYTSRQVRVLEVCPREETRCAALLSCLDHLKDPDPR